MMNKIIFDDTQRMVVKAGHSIVLIDETYSGINDGFKQSAHFINIDSDRAKYIISECELIHNKVTEMWGLIGMEIMQKMNHAIPNPSQLEGLNTWD